MREVFNEAIAVHMIFMAAGIKPDDIYVTVGAVSPQGAGDQLAVFVKQGDFTFTVTVGVCKMARADFEREWPKHVEGVHKLSDDEAAKLRDSTHIRMHAAEIMAGLNAKRAAFNKTRGN